MFISAAPRTKISSRGGGSTGRQPNPVWTAPPTKGDVIFGRAKKHDDCCSKGRKYIRENSPSLEDKRCSSTVEETNSTVLLLMKKLENNHSALPLPAANHWPLFGQQADTFHRALSSAAGQLLTQPLEAQITQVNFCNTSRCLSETLS